jgi:hypothetical protein
VASLYPAQVTQADESYRLTVTLNERDGTFDYNEVRTSSEWEAGFTDDGFKLGGEIEWHTGKRVEKSWSFQFGGLNRSSTGGDDRSDQGPALQLAPISRLEPQGFSRKAIRSLTSG